MMLASQYCIRYIRMIIHYIVNIVDFIDSPDLYNYYYSRFTFALFAK